MNRVTQRLAAQDLAEDFNRYFASVFTIENMSSLPTADTILHGTDEDKLRNISID